LLAGGAALALVSSPASAQPPAPGTPYVLDGPSSAISQPSALGMSIARDGTGGLVYLKSVGGVSHVFVSRLVGGLFQPPVQVDSQLAGASSQPVIAAGNGGILLVGFVNSGQLYVADGNGAGQFAAPLYLAGGASNPAISMTNFGKAYLAFTVADGGGHDVRAAYYYAGSWALEGAPLNASPADDAGTGGGRPAVAAAGDGIAIVAWGEQGHIYSRRVWGTSPSVVEEQADAPLSGCSETSVDDPVIGAGGDSSYAAVAFHAQLICNGQQQSRVLLNRLQGSVYDGVAAADPGAADGADDPQIAVSETGRGWVTCAGAASNNVYAASLLANSAFAGSVIQVNSLPSSQPPDAAPAIAGLNANLIAWQQQPGSTPGGEIRVRFAGDAATLGPEMVISSPAQGPTDAADGLAAAGDISGDAAIAWLQGAPNAIQLVVNQLYQPPGSFSATNTFAYARNPQPLLAWTQPTGWGPLRYSLVVDGQQLAQTSYTAARVPVPLADGRHYWRVTVTNPAGQQSATALNTVFVDTVAPTAHIHKLSRLPGRGVRIVVRYFDRPPAGEPAFDASGVKTVVIHWGDGKVLRIRVGSHLGIHHYRHAGRYKITVVLTDRAGNRTRLVRYVRIGRRAH